MYARIMEDDSDILKQSVKTKVEKECLKVMPGSRSGTFNQALMELGAMICVPNGAPKCGVCPVAEYCQARVHGTVLNLPVKKKRQARRTEEKTVLKKDKQADRSTISGKWVYNIGRRWRRYLSFFSEMKYGMSVDNSEILCGFNVEYMWIKCG